MNILNCKDVPPTVTESPHLMSEVPLYEFLGPYGRAYEPTRHLRDSPDTPVGYLVYWNRSVY